MLSIMLFLSGCMRIDPETGTPSGGFSQFLFDYLVLPTQQFIEILADFTGSYGLAIIAITIIVRVLILPLSIKQTAVDYGTTGKNVYSETCYR
ncbi:MAG: hypothetical protein U5K84_05370 [Alkalibacterium sp.]|nr:hypothetical protein [Alkalibacterium sp.]